MLNITLENALLNNLRVNSTGLKRQALDLILLDRGYIVAIVATNENFKLYLNKQHNTFKLTLISFLKRIKKWLKA